MRGIIVAVVAGLVVLPVAGQDIPKPTPEGKAALEKLIAACVDAGGLKREPRPNGKGDRLVIADPAKLEAAVKAAKDLPTKPLCDALVAGWFSVSEVEQNVHTELLRIRGQVAQDDRMVGFADFLEAWGGDKRLKYRRSVELYPRAAERFAASGEPLWEAASYNNLGFVCQQLGQPDVALGHYTWALAVRQQWLPGNNPSVAQNLNNVGLAYKELGDYDRALQYLLQSLAMKRQLITGNHPSLATTLTNIGLVYDESGESGKAAEFHARALEMFRKSYPGGHLSVAVCLDNLGSAEFRLGNGRRALGCYTSALAVLEGLFSGEDHPAVAVNLNNVGFAYAHLLTRR